MLDKKIILIGAGPTNLMLALSLVERGIDSKSFLIIDQGKESNARKCPATIESGCLNCFACDVVSGIGGAGMFSDGKLHRIKQDHFLEKHLSSKMSRMLSRLSYLENHSTHDSKEYHYLKSLKEATRRLNFIQKRFSNEVFNILSRFGYINMSSRGDSKSRGELNVG